MIELDQIDTKAASSLEGYLVRKDLVRTFSRQFPVPTYVVEFLLGRYCASTDQEEIEEGLEIVQRQLKSRLSKRVKKSFLRPGPGKMVRLKSSTFYRPAGCQDRFLCGNAAQLASDRCPHQPELVNRMSEC